MESRSQKLFHYLLLMAENIQVCAQDFHEGVQDLSDIDAFAAKVKEHEHKGDELVSDLINLLNATYITPIEREDFHSIGVKLDDIVDGLEACSVRLDLYNVKEATPAMVEFAVLIRNCADEIGQAIRLLCERNLFGIRPHLGRLHELEKECDSLLRQTLKQMFLAPPDPIELIKLKEIYEILEGITDRCEDVADLLESVVVKNT